MTSQHDYLPKGWASRAAADCFDQISTNGIKVKNKDCNPSGLYPVIDQGKEFISGYIDDEDKLINLEKPVIVFGDHTRNIKWVDFSFVPGADGTKLLSPKKYLYPRIAFYGLKNLEIPDKGYSRHFKFLKELEFLLPPLAEQKVIADKLDTLLAQVETTKARLDRIPQILKTFRQSVLAAAMSGKLTEAWREKNDASAWQQKILGDVVTGISQGWSPKCLSEGTSDTSWGVIKTSSVQEIQFLEQENKKLPDNLEPREALKVEVGDILTTRAGPRSRCGVTCYVENLSLNLMICDKVYRYKAKTEIGHSKFLVMQLNSHPTLENIESLKTGISESGMNLTQKKFKALPLKWPSKEEQTQIVSRVEELFAFAERIEQKANAALERVNNLTQSILAKAFRGELTADWRAQNPDLISGDNSAEALLEKIKAERDANKNANKSKKKITRKAKPKKEIQPKILLENPVVDVLNKKGIAKPQAIFDELKELMDLREVLKEISQLLEQQVIKEIDKDGQQYLEINR